ncbi:MAG: translation elongation factor Ts [Pseudohongiellaceae bacterium]
MANIEAALVKELRDRTSLGMMECKNALVESNGDIDQAIELLRKASGMKAAKKAGRIAAEGVVLVKISSDRSAGAMVEVNSETDFAAKEGSFNHFSKQVLEAAFDTKESDVSKLMDSELEPARLGLVQKIGENITVRRVAVISEEGLTVGSYVHSNNKIAVLINLRGGDETLSKDIAMHIAALNPMVVNAEEVSAEVLSKESRIYTAQALESGKPADIVEKMVSGRLRKFIEEVTLTEQAFVKDPDIKVGKLLKDGHAEVTSFIRFEVGEGIELAEVDFAAEVAEQLKGSE